MAWQARATIYFIMGGLWLSGCLWLLLDEFFSEAGPFGRTPNTLEPAVLLIHGVVSVAALYVLGWVSVWHVLRWWRQGLRRVSGATLSTCLSLLVVSGFALFFVSEDWWQHAAALSHDVVGLIVTVVGVQHWFFARRSDMRSAASRP